VSVIDEAPVRTNHVSPALDAFWDRAAIAKLEAKFAVASEMAELPHLPIQLLREIVFQYRYFTQAFATDLAVLVARCPEGALRSLFGQLINEELGNGDPEQAHMRLFDRFLESIGAIERGAAIAATDDRIHPRVRELIEELRQRTTQRSLLYAIGMRGVGGECVCGVYFSVMHVQLRCHPFFVQHDAAIDWTFWDIHAGHADLEHNQLVRTAVKDFVARDASPSAITELSEGFDFGTATWDAFWSTVYAAYGHPRD
jgi:hypothetical protein